MARKRRGKLAKRASTTIKRTPTRFHLFPRLPPELRLMVWESAFPQIALESQVFELKINGPYRIRSGDDNESSESSICIYELHEGRSLMHQTLPLRKLSAINQETRGFLQRTLPDSLSFFKPGSTSKMSRIDLIDGFYGDQGRFRMRKETDIIYFDAEPHMPQHKFELFIDDEFKNTIRNIGFTFRYWSQSLDWLEWLEELPHLKRLYYGSSHMSMHCSEHLSLCSIKGCQQHDVFRYPTIKMARNDLALSAWTTKIETTVKLMAAEKGWDLLPLLKMNPGLLPSLLEGL